MPQETGHETEHGEVDDAVECAEDINLDLDESDDHGSCAVNLDEGFGGDNAPATVQTELSNAPESELLNSRDSGISLDEAFFDDEAYNSQESELGDASKIEPLSTSGIDVSREEAKMQRMNPPSGGP